MIFTKDIKMADVILQNHHLLSVINRFGIQLGFGDKSIKEVCKIYDINPDFFLEIINTFNDPDFYPQHHLEKFPLKLIIDFLYQAHAFYQEQKIPEIAKMIEQLMDNSPEEQQNIMHLIQKFFDEYRQQLSEHIAREEQTVYPYILQLEDYITGGEQTAESLQELRKYHIDDYAQEHDNIEEKLSELKNILIKYLPPQRDYVLCYKILGQLGHLEEDMNNHSAMENKILIPRVKLMEQNLENNRP